MEGSAQDGWRSQGELVPKEDRGGAALAQLVANIEQVASSVEHLLAVQGRVVGKLEGIESQQMVVNATLQEVLFASRQQSKTPRFVSDQAEEMHNKSSMQIQASPKHENMKAYASLPALEVMANTPSDRTHGTKTWGAVMPLGSSVRTGSGSTLHSGFSSSRWPATIEMRKELRSQDDDSPSDISVEELHQAILSSTCIQPIAEHKPDPHPSKQFFERFVLRPHGRIRTTLDLSSFVVLWYDLIGIPFILAWGLPMQGTVKLVTSVAIFFWTFEFGTNFLTSIYVDGRLEEHPKKIALAYLRGWFLPDICVLSMDWLSFVIEETAVSKLARLSKAGRLLRLGVGLLRTTRVAEIFERMQDRSLSARAVLIVEVMKALGIVLWMNHLVACLWFVIGRTAPSDTGMRWIQAPIGDGEETYAESAMAYQYFTSLHWSMTQMTPGSLQVHAHNTVERIFNIFCLIFGVVFFSSLVSTASSKSTEYRMGRQDAFQKLAVLRRFLRQREIPLPLANAVQRQVNERMSTQRSLLVKEVPALSSLSMSLQMQLQYEICSHCLITHPLFRWWSMSDGGGMEKLCHTAMEFVAYAKGDTIFVAGTEASLAYVIASGSLLYTQDPQSSRVLDKVSTNLSMSAWLCEVALWANWRHVGTSEALSASELLSISAEGLLKTVVGRRLIRQVIHDYGRTYHSRLVTCKPPLYSYPDDIEVPCTNLEQMLSTMQFKTQAIIAVAALSTISRSWTKRAILRTEFDLLRNEIMAGRCALMLTGAGEIQRIVAVGVVRLVRSDGRILVKLGTWFTSERKAKPDCKLPGSKQLQGETPMHVIHRVLREQLAPLAFAVQLGRVEFDVESALSTRTQLTTRYTRMECAAELNEDNPLPVLLTAQPLGDGSHSTAGSTWGQATQGLRNFFGGTISDFTADPAESEFRHRINPEHVLVLASDVQKTEGPQLFAWLTQDEFAYFNNPIHQNVLKQLLSALTVSAGVVAEAEKIQKQAAANLAEEIATMQEAELESPPPEDVQQPQSLWGSNLHLASPSEILNLKCKVMSM